MKVEGEGGGGRGRGSGGAHPELAATRSPPFGSPLPVAATPWRRRAPGRVWGRAEQRRGRHPRCLRAAAALTGEARRSSWEL